MVIKIFKQKPKKFGIRIFPEWHVIDRKHWKRVYERDGLFEAGIIHLYRWNLWIFRNKKIYNDKILWKIINHLFG